MTVSIAAGTALILGGDTPVRRPAAVGRWTEIAMLGLALLVAPLAFVVGLAIYAVRHYTR